MVPQLKLLRLTEIPQIQTYIDLFHGEIYILHAGDEVRFIKGPHSDLEGSKNQTKLTGRTVNAKN